MSKEGGVLAGLGLIATAVTIVAAGASDRPSNAQLNRDALDALNGRGATTGEPAVMTLRWEGSLSKVQCRQGNPNGLLTSDDPDGMASMGFACDNSVSTKDMIADINGTPIEVEGTTINPFQVLNQVR